MLEPVVGILMTRQVRHHEAAEVLKAAYLQASARSFVAQGKLPSVSTLSVATGIGRVEIKRLLDSPLTAKSSKMPPAGRVRLHWITDPAYLDENGQPRRLPRAAPNGQVSFYSLAALASKDTHPRAILDELLRLGAVAEEGDYVSLVHQSIKVVNSDQRLMDGVDNASDHLSALLVNLLSTPPPLLERAIFAQGLTKSSAARAVAVASDVWAKMLGELREKLQTLVDLDKDASDNDWRIRIGVYSYMAPTDRPQAPISARENKKRSTAPRRAGAAAPAKRRAAAVPSTVED